MIKKIKSLIIPFCICLFTILLITFSNSNLESCKLGLNLWVNSVVPSLFPFLIATELLGYTNIVYILGKLLDKIMRPVFNVPGIAAFPFIMGIISGYPIGAKIVSDLKLKKKLTNEEAERLLAFTNNSGPLFIIGTVGISFFYNIRIGILLLITHILASLTVGFIFRWWKSSSKRNDTKLEESLLYHNQISMQNLGQVLSNSIMNAVNTILLIGGFIVLFSVIISILEKSKFLNTPSFYINGIIAGIIELTNGIYKITSFPNNYSIIICAFLIGFGGLSVCLQIISIVSKAKISIKPYIIGKLLQGLLAAAYTYLIIYSL